MVPRRGMQPSTARNRGQVEPRRNTIDIPPPQSAALGLHPVARRLLLINRPCREGTLSWPWYTAATGGSRTHNLAIARPAAYHSATTYLRRLQFWMHSCTPGAGQWDITPKAFRKHFHQRLVRVQPLERVRIKRLWTLNVSREERYMSDVVLISVDCGMVRSTRTVHWPWLLHPETSTERTTMRRSWGTEYGACATASAGLEPPPRSALPLCCWRCFKNSTF